MGHVMAFTDLNWHVPGILLPHASSVRPRMALLTLNTMPMVYNRHKELITDQQNVHVMSTTSTYQYMYIRSYIYTVHVNCSSVRVQIL